MNHRSRRLALFEASRSILQHRHTALILAAIESRATQPARHHSDRDSFRRHKLPHNAEARYRPDALARRRRQDRRYAFCGELGDESPAEVIGVAKLEVTVKDIAMKQS